MYKVIAGSWTQFEEDAKYIREQVFIQEQGIEPKDEWDDFDSTAVHFMVY
ncbi:GNAT family N-acetyltransferase, partial [Pseudomonas aeruginosa]